MYPRAFLFLHLTSALGKFFILFCRLLIFSFFFSGIPLECQTDWMQIRPNVMSGLIWVQTVCKSYQQKTPGDKDVKLQNLRYMKVLNYIICNILEDFENASPYFCTFLANRICD